MKDTEIETYTQGRPTCPHCGHRLDDDEMNYGPPTSDADLWGLAPNEESAAVQCPRCDKDYWVQGGFRPEYTSAFSEEQFMTSTPNLPPLPDEDGYILITIAERPVEVNGYRNSTMEAYALAAYHAGRDAGLSEAEQVCDNRAMDRERATNNCDNPDDIAELRSGAWILSDCARSIRALKSDAKGGA